MEQTADGKVNRYYYHWMLDTDNNPATGRSNAEYEGTPTGVVKPVGAERVVMIGWRDGKPNGVEAYDPADEDHPLVSNFPFQASGNTVKAVVPLAGLGLVAGQTIAISAFQEGASDGWAVDWMESANLTLTPLEVPIARIADGADLADTSGDITSIGAHVLGDTLFLSMTVQGAAAPSMEQTPEGKVNRYYYHWMLDTDNNPATGRSNAEYEGTPTGVVKPVGAERVVMIGWRDGKPNGVEAYDPADEDHPLVSDFPFEASGNTLSAAIPLAALGLSLGQTIAVSAFQEGASDDWAVDWAESTTLTLSGPEVGIARVSDPQDLGDTSGDILGISAYVLGDSLQLAMRVQGAVGPATEQTPEGKVNRYYYHWMLDTDNNPATGRSNAEYEGTPTGVVKPVGAERVVMIGWRDGKPNGVEAYDPADEDHPLVTDFSYQIRGNSVNASIPLTALGLTEGQTIAVSAFQEGASDDWSVDWMESTNLTLNPPSTGRMKIDGAFEDWNEAAALGGVAQVDDPADLGDSSGDIKRIQATVENGNLFLRMTVAGIALPTVEQTPEGKVNRYYYHWLLDTDNNPATGRSNAEYEGTPTGLQRPVGSERIVMLGWKDGAPNGLEVYDPLNEDVALYKDFAYKAGGDSVEVSVPLTALGLVEGQTIAVSAFQEGASDGWAVDWIESAVFTLKEAAPATFTLDHTFAGDAYGYEIVVQDGANQVVAPETVQVTLDGGVVASTVAKVGTTTRITGKHASLLAVDSLHKLNLALKASGANQAKEFVFKISPYTLLSTLTSLKTLDQSKTGFVTYTTQISQDQLGGGVWSVHSNVAEVAERQLAGQMVDENSGQQFINEAAQDWTKWQSVSNVVPGVINWYELAPDQQASLNFPNDEPIPNLPGNASVVGGDVIEILTYLGLEAGYHKLGLYTEGGHKVNAGLSPADPVVSLLDNSGGIERVPSYYGRNQFFDVVAPEAGFYPIRFVWFQTKRNQEAGLMLELFSVKGQALHLLNRSDDPDSIKAYRAGVLIGQAPPPAALKVRRDGGNVVIEFTGTLQVADSVTGPWTDAGTQSPATLPVTGSAAKFARSRN